MWIKTCVSVHDPLHGGIVDTKISCARRINVYCDFTYFVAVNFRELAETDIFADIGINGFRTGKITSLVIYASHCALNYFWFEHENHEN